MMIAEATFWLNFKEWDIPIFGTLGRGITSAYPIGMKMVAAL